MPPHLHLQAALATRNPLSFPPDATDPVKYSLKHAPEDMEATRAGRLEVCRLLRELAEACSDENKELLDMAGTEVKTVLRAFEVKKWLSHAAHAISLHPLCYSLAYR